MNSANMNQGIILNGLKKSLKGRKENYTHKKKFIKEGKKVIEKGIEDLKGTSSLERVTKIGAQIMLQVAIEEEVAAYLKRDYYEKNVCA
jgi:hypothetical protein